MLIFTDSLGRLQNPNSEETLQKFILLGGEIRDIKKSDIFILLTNGPQFFPIMGLIKGETITTDELNFAKRLGYKPVNTKGQYKYYVLNEAGNYQLYVHTLPFSFKRSSQ